MTQPKLSATDIKKLKEPFMASEVGVKVQSLNKERTQAMLVCYIQHTNFYGRLESVDPEWSSEITEVKTNDVMRDGKKTGEYFNVRMKMTVKGVARENVGEGDDLKSATSDAFKRVGMLFGVGRYMYDTETVWVSYNETKDKYRVWRLCDHDDALRDGQERTPTSDDSPTPQANTSGDFGNDASSGTIGAAPIKTKANPTTRMDLGKEINAISKVLNLSVADRTNWIQELYKCSAQEMTPTQMGAFLGVLQGEMGRR